MEFRRYLTCVEINTFKVGKASAQTRWGVENALRHFQCVAQNAVRTEQALVTEADRADLDSRVMQPASAALKTS